MGQQAALRVEHTGPRLLVVHRRIGVGIQDRRQRQPVPAAEIGGTVTGKIAHHHPILAHLHAGIDLSQPLVQPLRQPQAGVAHQQVHVFMGRDAGALAVEVAHEDVLLPPGVEIVGQNAGAHLVRLIVAGIVERDHRDRCLRVDRERVRLDKELPRLLEDLERAARIPLGSDGQKHEIRRCNPDPAGITESTKQEGEDQNSAHIEETMISNVDFCRDFPTAAEPVAPRPGRSAALPQVKFPREIADVEGSRQKHPVVL